MAIHNTYNPSSQEEGQPKVLERLKEGSWTPDLRAACGGNFWRKADLGGLDGLRPGGHYPAACIRIFLTAEPENGPCTSMEQ